jgi:hypothetical protein
VADFSDPFADIGAPKQAKPAVKAAEYADPFADIGAAKKADSQENDSSPFTSLLKQAGQKAMGVLSLPEKYLDAPFRAAVTNAAPFALTGNYMEGAKSAGRAFKEQFGKDPEKAPSFGLAGDVVLAPSNIVPIGAAAMGLKNLGSKAAGGVSKAASNFVPKVGEALTGVSANTLKNYAKNVDEVESMLSKYKGNIANAADDIKIGIMGAVQSTRKGLNESLGKILDSSTELLDSKPVLNSLKKSRAAIDPKLRPEEASGLDELINRLESVANESGFVPAKKLYDIKQFLQEGAKSAYKQPGSIFSKGGAVSRAALNAARNARPIIRDALPDAGKIDDSLSKLHRVEKNMNRNLLKEGASENALVSVGRGATDRNRQALERLGSITGQDFIPQSENLAAFKDFADASYLPQDLTGKSMTRLLAGMATGTLVGGPVGTVLGAVATSPAAVRRAIQYGRYPAKGLGYVASAPGKLASRALDVAGKNPDKIKALLAAARANESLGREAIDAISSEEPTLTDTEIAEGISPKEAERILLMRQMRGER